MRLLLLSVLLFFIGYKAQAQKYMGIKTGVSLATATGLVDWNYLQPGFHAGLYREDYLNKSLIFRSELLYNQKGWRATAFVPNYGKIDLRFRLNYLDALVVLHWKPITWVSLYPGLQLGVLLNHKVWISPGKLQVEYEDPSRVEFAPLIGTNLKLNRHIGIDFRFTYGTWSIDGYPVAKNVVGMCSLEYTL